MVRVEYDGGHFIVTRRYWARAANPLATKFSPLVAGPREHRRYVGRGVIDVQHSFLTFTAEPAVDFGRSLSLCTGIWSRLFCECLGFYKICVCGCQWSGLYHHSSLAQRGLSALALAHRIGELKEQRSEAVSDAQHDSLTGLLNRRGMSERFQQARQRTKQPVKFCLVLVDLDGFKPINDRYGHHVGDKVLINVAKRLKASIRNERSDWVVRFGGDEFGVILSQLSSEPEVFCERLREAVEAPMQIGSEQIAVGASIGSACSVPGEAFETVYKRADDALYRNKSARRAAALSTDRL